MTCEAHIRDRAGADLGYKCNLPKGHLGKHAEVWQRENETVALLDLEGEEPEVPQE